MTAPFYVHWLSEAPAEASWIRAGLATNFAEQGLTGPAPAPQETALADALAARGA